jgi:alkanesulfonate monooxygenase SsuD/methylene tetrahydromethanopterin reductase-like flavin-dependent oxidoreductase (luciferase family)
MGNRIKKIDNGVVMSPPVVGFEPLALGLFSLLNFTKSKRINANSHVKRKMKFGIYAPNFGNTFGNPKLVTKLAIDAEKSGWDGFFLWDHIFNTEGFPDTVDPFIALTSVAENTEKIYIGTTVTPLPRRRPWKLARETVTLDILSEGRLILGIGLGNRSELSLMNEETNPRKMAEMADEHLEILYGLWSGEEFSYTGKYYKIDKVKFLPRPVQKPRIKIWGAGTWPKKGPFRRAAKLDGVVPLSEDYTNPLTPDDYRKMIEYMKKHGLRSPYDTVKISFNIPESEKKGSILEFQDAGVNWWLELVSDWSGNYEKIKDIITQGPTQL